MRSTTVTLGGLSHLRPCREAVRITEPLRISPSQMEERVLLDLMDMRAQLKAADSDGRLRLEKEVAGLSRQIADYQSGSHAASTSASASLDLRIQAVEAQNAKVTETRRQTPPPPPDCHGWLDFKMPLPVSSCRRSCRTCS